MVIPFFYYYGVRLYSNVNVDPKIIRWLKENKDSNKEYQRLWDEFRSSGGNSSTVENINKKYYQANPNASAKSGNSTKSTNNPGGSSPASKSKSNRALEMKGESSSNSLPAIMDKKSKEGSTPKPGKKSSGGSGRSGGSLKSHGVSEISRPARVRNLGMHGGVVKRKRTPWGKYAAIGAGGLAGVGLAGYALKKYMDKKKRERQEAQEE